MPQGATFADPLEHGTIVCFEADGDVVRIDPRTERTLERFPSPFEGMTVCEVSHGVAVARHRMRITAFDLQTRQILVDDVLGSHVFCHAVSPNAATIAVGEHGGKVQFLQTDGPALRGLVRPTPD
jgi:hypothetical protein